MVAFTAKLQTQLAYHSKPPAGLWLRTVLASQGLLFWVAAGGIACDPVGVSAKV